MDSGLVAANATGITTPRNEDSDKYGIELGVRTLSPVLLDPQSNVVSNFNPGMWAKRRRHMCVDV